MTRAQPRRKPTHPTDPVAPPAEDTPRPIEDASRPIEDASRPIEDASRPIEDASRPIEDASRPTEDTPRPTEDTPRPTEDTPRPTEDTPRPNRGQSALSFQDTPNGSCQEGESRSLWITRLGWEILAVGVPLLAVLLSYPPASWSMPVAIAACIALPLRLRWPWLAFALCLPALYGGLGWPPALVALYRVGLCARRVRSTVIAVVIVFVTVQVANQFNMDEPLANQIMSAMFSVVVPAAPAALGVLVRLRAELSATLAERDQARRAELSARLDSARADERARITREIHDAVGHNTTLIAVQAAALSATTTDPAAKETADQLRHLAKQSIAEMRAALGLSAPQHGLDDLPTLINHTRSVGVDITFSPTTATPSPMVSRAVYRVVQEALTNAVKHAPGAPVTITLTRDAGRIVVSVVNGTPTRPAPDLSPGGTGLEGLTERVRTAGGTLTTARLPDGGFALQATLPAHDPTKVGPRTPDFRR